MMTRSLAALLAAAFFLTIVAADQELTCYHCRGFIESKPEDSKNSKDCEIYSFNADKVEQIKNTTNQQDYVLECFTIVIYAKDMNKGEPITFRGIHGHKTDRRNRTREGQMALGSFIQEEDLKTLSHGSSTEIKELMSMPPKTNANDLKAEDHHFYWFMDICETNLCNTLEDNGVGKIMPGFICFLLPILASLYFI